MRNYRAELHVHTVLSPCAEVEMIPPLIVTNAIEKGIEIIAITDHNSSANILSVQKAAIGTNLTIIPGMELTTHEEVHLLCLFGTMKPLTHLQSLVDKQMQKLKNRPDFFGEQFIVDETGNYISSDERLLLGTVNITLANAVAFVHELGGLAIPAHIDRKANGLIANLGFIPDDLCLDALEISKNKTVEKMTNEYPQIRNYPLLKGGDAHILDNILGLNHFYINEPNYQEIGLAFQNKNNRKHQIID